MASGDKPAVNCVDRWVELDGVQFRLGDQRRIEIKLPAQSDQHGCQLDIDELRRALSLAEQNRYAKPPTQTVEESADG